MYIVIEKIYYVYIAVFTAKTNDFPKFRIVTSFPSPAVLCMCRPMKILSRDLNGSIRFRGINSRTTT